MEKNNRNNMNRGNSRVPENKKTQNKKRPSSSKVNSNRRYEDERRASYENRERSGNKMVSSSKRPVNDRSSSVNRRYEDKSSIRNSEVRNKQKNSGYSAAPAKKRKRRIRIKARFMLLLILIAAIIITVLSLPKTVPECYEIKSNSITIYETSKAVIIKNETGFKYPEESTLVSRVNDGSYVKIGDVIAVVKTSNFDPDWYEQLTLARAATVDYMIRQLGEDNEIVKHAVKVIDGEIKELTNKMLNSAISDPDLYAQYSAELEALYIEKRETLLSALGTDIKIKDYLNDEKKIADYMKSATLEITAVKEGIISYNTDGYSSKYNWSNIDNITASDVKAILDDKISSSLGDLMKEYDYYISNADENYILILDEEDKFKYLKETEEIITEINSNIGCVAIIRKNIVVDGDNYIVIQPKSPLEKLYRERVVNVNIHKSWNGLIIPKEHIVTKRGKTGVYVYENKKSRFVSIDILVENESVVIVDIDAIDNQIKEGTMIVKQTSEK